jgi:EAL domain-containing protein (putative c-di-GMP-specific phosphodiesterase class I)
VPANKLCFEITETSAIANLAAATDFISRLHAQGCSFALDDFGSGLSSFGYLRSLPVDFVKIDGSLVCSMLADPTNSAMVTSITQIGRAMGKRIVAEWVEDAPTLQHLASLGVHYGQGNGIAQARALEAPVH